MNKEEKSSLTKLLDLVFVPSSLIRLTKKINESGEGTRLYYVQATCLELLRLYGYVELYDLLSQ